MNRKEQAEAASVLKALTNDWDLIDNAAAVDFLVFVNEDRDELDFYPKKSLIGMMERSGLIENLDAAGSATRIPYTHYEGSASGWKEITEAGSILFQYRITSKGQKFLHDAPGLIGGPVPPLRVARSPVEIPSQPLKVVIYDRQAIQKLVEDFERKAKTQIGAMFLPSVDTDLSNSIRRGLMCGPRLWEKLKSQAERNGLRPMASLVQHTWNMNGKHEVQPLTDKPLLADSDVRLFVKTFREVFNFNGAPAIRRAEAGELTSHPYQRRSINEDLPTPDLSDFTLGFIVEANDSRFMVLVKSEADADLKHFGPAVRWIELTDR